MAAHFRAGLPDVLFLPDFFCRHDRFRFAGLHQSTRQARSGHAASDAPVIRAGRVAALDTDDLRSGQPGTAGSLSGLSDSDDDIVAKIQLIELLRGVLAGRQAVCMEGIVVKSRNFRRPDKDSALVPHGALSLLGYPLASKPE